MKYRLTCNDCIKTMKREVVVVTAETLNEAWEKAKTKFAWTHKTQKAFVEITATERIA